MSDDWQNQPAPSVDHLSEVAERAMASLPDLFRQIGMQLAITVEDVPTADICAEFDREDVHELTGIYVGEPLTQQSILDQSPGPSHIILYRQAILNEWVTRGNVTLFELVLHIVVHELGHHMGLTDDDIAQIDRWWE